MHTYADAAPITEIDAYRYSTYKNPSICIVVTFPNDAELEVCQPDDTVSLARTMEQRRAFASSFLWTFQQTFSIPYYITDRFLELTYGFRL